ncbi:MAG: UvrB/UvrC motif-containing protein [Pirellulales bacterium]
MSDSLDIDSVLSDWPFEPGEVRVRLVNTEDGRQVVQMRIELGLLQMEVTNRPDGTRPGGAATYLDYLLGLTLQAGGHIDLSDEQRMEIDREFLQFYYRRICWLAVREFGRAVADAEHSLAMMDFVKAHSTQEEWKQSHEQYRPFVLFHRTQAAALAELEASGAEAAIEVINEGLARLRQLFIDYGAEERFEEDEMVSRLGELKESLREHYGVGPTLTEQLAQAVADEQYEVAARLRDEIARRSARSIGTE